MCVQTRAVTVCRRCNTWLKETDITILLVSCRDQGIECTALWEKTEKYRRMICDDCKKLPRGMLVPQKPDPYPRRRLIWEQPKVESKKRWWQRLYDWARRRKDKDQRNPRIGTGLG